MDFVPLGEVGRFCVLQEIGVIGTVSLRFGINDSGSGMIPWRRFFGFRGRAMSKSCDQRGEIEKPLHVQFVFGIKNALPPRREILEFQVAQLRKLAPEATWTAAGLG